MINLLRTETGSLGYGVTWTSGSDVCSKKRFTVESSIRQTEVGDFSHSNSYTYGLPASTIHFIVEWMAFVVKWWHAGQMNPTWPFRLKRSNTAHIRWRTIWSDLCHSDCHEKIKYRLHRSKKLNLGNFNLWPPKNKLLLFLVTARVIQMHSPLCGYCMLP